MKEFLSLIKKWMTRLLAGIATVLLSIMTLLVLYQVFTRYIFPCYGMLCMPGCSFLSMSFYSICCFSSCGIFRYGRIFPKISAITGAAMVPP